jgi:hypothetical protein
MYKFKQCNNVFKNNPCQICYHNTKSLIDGKHYCTQTGKEIECGIIKECDEFLDGRED